MSKMFNTWSRLNHQRVEVRRLKAALIVAFLLVEVVMVILANVDIPPTLPLASAAWTVAIAAGALAVWLASSMLMDDLR